MINNISTICNLEIWCELIMYITHSNETGISPAGSLLHVHSVDWKGLQLIEILIIIAPFESVLKVFPPT